MIQIGKITAAPDEAGNFGKNFFLDSIFIAFVDDLFFQPAEKDKFRKLSSQGEQIIACLAFGRIKAIDAQLIQQRNQLVDVSIGIDDHDIGVYRAGQIRNLAIGRPAKLQKCRGDEHAMVVAAVLADLENLRPPLDKRKQIPAPQIRLPVDDFLGQLRVVIENRAGPFPGAQVANGSQVESSSGINRLVAIVESAADLIDLVF